MNNMENGYNIFAPRGVNALLVHDMAANDYFNSLPDDVQDMIRRKAGALNSTDELYALARHYMQGR